MTSTMLVSRPTTTHGLPATLDAYLHAAEQVAADHNFAAGWCITAAALTRHVLTRFGIPGVRVVGVDFAAFNPLAWELMQAGVPMDRWPDHASAVNTGGTDETDDTGWDGHALAYIPSKVDGRSAWIIDPSATQFSEPGQLTLRPLRARVPAHFLAGEPVPIPIADGGIVIRRNPALTRHRLPSTAVDELVEMMGPETERLMSRALFATH